MAYLAIIIMAASFIDLTCGLIATMVGDALTAIKGLVGAIRRLVR
jgi:hypothetical protein